MQVIGLVMMLNGLKLSKVTPQEANIKNPQHSENLGLTLRTDTNVKHHRCNPYVAPRRNQKWPKYIIVHGTYIISYITNKSEGVPMFDPSGREVDVVIPVNVVVRGGGGF